GLGADGRVDAVAVEAAALASRHGGTVPPGCVRVAVDLALRASVVEEPLAVAVGGHVARVDSNLAAHVRVLLPERSGKRVQASRQHFPLGAELAGEAVASPMR